MTSHEKYSYILEYNGDGSGEGANTGGSYPTYTFQPIDRKRLMIVLADLEYILVRATHGQAVNVIG